MRLLSWAAKFLGSWNISDKFIVVSDVRVKKTNLTISSSYREAPTRVFFLVVPLTKSSSRHQQSFL